MQQHIQLHPGTNRKAAGTIAPKILKAPKSKLIRGPKFPRNVVEFAKVAKKVANTWARESELTLPWLTQPVFEQQAVEFSKALNYRKHTRDSDKSEAVRMLVNLDAKASYGLKFVKGYISEKWEIPARAIAQYPRYGIDMLSGSFILPRDRQSRLAAMALTIEAIANDGFSGEKYGIAFWIDLKRQYGMALDAANEQDGATANGVNNKKLLRKTIIKGMTALQHLIMANYPDEIPARFRAWGWQNEDY